MGLFSAGVISRFGPPIAIEYLIVGGGGASQAYDSTRTTGGGGAGGFISGSAVVTPGYTDLSVVVGAGGPRIFGATVANDEGADGNNSLFLGLTALGGGGGGNSNGGGSTWVSDGRPGGSGGGAGASRNSSNTNVYVGSGGSGSIGQGYNGGNSYSKGAIDGSSYQWRQGQGGGAGGNATSASLGVASIAGPEKAWLDGFTYAGGGGLNGYASSGSGGQTQFNTTAGTEGRNGIVKVRYSGSVALFTGGEINISGGYVYHSFIAPTQNAFTASNGYYTLGYTGG